MSPSNPPIGPFGSRRVLDPLQRSRLVAAEKACDLIEQSHPYLLLEDFDFDSSGKPPPFKTISLPINTCD